jgi:vacuolar-type H+-ATPase subunit I/STV1
MIKSCKVIHVDNPPLGVEDEDEININRRKREKSRITLLEHLATYQDVYRPQKLQGITGKISKLMIEEKNETEKEVTGKKQRLEKLKSQEENSNESIKEQIKNLEQEICEAEDKKKYLTESIYQGELQEQILEKKGIK